MEKSEKYHLAKAATSENWWVLTDTENLIVVRFKEHEFNETQEVTLLEDINPNPVALATAMREIREWLRNYHYDLIF